MADVRRRTEFCAKKSGWLTLGFASARVCGFLSHPAMPKSKTCTNHTPHLSNSSKPTHIHSTPPTKHTPDQLPALEMLQIGGRACGGAVVPTSRCFGALCGVWSTANHCTTRNPHPKRPSLIWLFWCQFLAQGQDTRAQAAQNGIQRAHTT